MSGFSLVRTNPDTYAWRCNSCHKEYTNAHEAEDCCSKLGMSYHSCNKSDYHHRVRQLESRVRELEAERDRLKEERDQFKCEIGNLRDREETYRARHAALVEKANHAYSEWEGGSHREAIAAMEELKAALWEVK